jgi:hypothetical protein
MMRTRFHDGCPTKCTADASPTADEEVGTVHTALYAGFIRSLTTTSGEDAAVTRAKMSLCLIDTL